MALNGKRVLIVEDDYLLAAALAAAVTAAGGRVAGMANSVDAALDIAATGDVDGAIIKVRLMGERTFRVADALAARQIPFVFATGLSSQDAPARFADVPWLGKPHAANAVCDALAGVMRQARQGDC